MRRLMLAMLPLVALSIGCGDKDDGDSGSGDDGSDGADGSDGSDGGDGGDASAGATVFASSCSGCHGSDGEGVSAPAMSSVIPGMSAAEIADVAMNGTGGMPAILSGNQADADDVAAYCLETWGG